MQDLFTSDDTDIWFDSLVCTVSSSRKKETQFIGLFREGEKLRARSSPSISGPYTLDMDLGLE